MIRIAIADDHQVVIDGLALIFQEQAEDIQLVGTANTGEEFIELLEDNSVDVAILDISMPGMENGKALREIRERFYKVKVLMLTMHKNIENINLMIDIGAKGYLLKNKSGKEVVKAVRAIYNGEHYFSDDVQKVIVNARFEQANQHHTTGVDQDDIKVTKREEAVLKLLADDYSGQMIADELNVSPKTVEAHKKNLMAKIGAKSEKGLVRFAVENGYV